MIKLDDEELEAAEAAGVPLIKAPDVTTAVRTVIGMMGFNNALLSDQQVAEGMLWMIGREIGSSLKC